MYEEMKKELTREIESRLSKGQALDIRKTVKGGAELDSFIITKEDECIYPTFYFKNYLSDYSEGVSIKEIADEIFKAYEQSLLEIPFIKIGDFQDFETQKDKIAFKIVNTKVWKEQLKDIPYIQFLDLSIIFYFEMELSESQSGTCNITNSLMKSWNIDENTLFELAKKNTPKLYPIEMDSMTNMMFKINFGVEYDITFEEVLENLNEDTLYVMTNKKNHFGFATIFYPNVLKKISKKIGDFYILPMSIHEALIVPSKEDVDEEYLKSMVYEINRKELLEEDFLSDNIYYYDFKEDELKVC